MNTDPCCQEREALKKVTERLTNIRKPSVSTKTIEELAPGEIKSEAEVQMDEAARQLIAEAMEDLRRAEEALSDCERRHNKPAERATRKSD